MRLLALLVALLIPSVASAQECREPLSTLDSQVFPRSPAGLAPTDTLIWYLTDERLATHEGIQRALSVVSLGGDGAVDVVPAGAALTPRRGLFAFRPVEPLSPNTDHEIQYPVHPLGDDLAVTSFRTTDGPSTEAPSIPTLESVALASDYSLLGDWCSSQDYRDEALYRLESDGMFDVVGRAGGAWTFAEDPLADEVAAIGSGDVSLQDDLAPLARFDVRFGSLNLAGDFSGWSEPEATEMPASGCRDNERGVTWAMPVLLLFGLGGLRRREAWVPLIAATIVLSVAVPTPAAAEEPPTRNWREVVLERTAQDLPVLVGVGVSAAVVDTVAFASLAPRGHGALQTRLVNITVLSPTLGALAAVGGVRRALLDRRSPKRIARGLRGAWIALISVAIPVSIFSQVGAVALGQTDVSLGVALMAPAASLWGTATTLIIYDDLVRSSRARMRTPTAFSRHRPRAPTLAAAGPGFLLLTF